MLRKSGRHVVALTLAAVLLGSAPAAATTAGQELPGWLARAWQWVTLWLGRAPLLKEDNGAHIDPNGAPLNNSDVSLHIDPNG